MTADDYLSHDERQAMRSVDRSKKFIDDPDWTTRRAIALLDCVDYLESEIVRLKRGDFTEKEFQDLCHGFSADDCERFKAGCKEYQRQLFGSIGFEERSEE